MRIIDHVRSSRHANAAEPRMSNVVGMLSVIGLLRMVLMFLKSMVVKQYRLIKIVKDVPVRIVSG